MGRSAFVLQRFNPRPPRGGRRRASTKALSVKLFQSTPPAWGATDLRVMNPTEVNDSKQDKQLIPAESGNSQQSLQPPAQPADGCIMSLTSARAYTSHLGAFTIPPLRSRPLVGPHVVMKTLEHKVTHGRKVELYASALRKSDPVVLGRSDPGQEQHWER